MAMASMRMQAFNREMGALDGKRRHRIYCAQISELNGAWGGNTLLKGYVPITVEPSRELLGRSGSTG
jgi:hypothetical protein